MSRTLIAMFLVIPQITFAQTGSDTSAQTELSYTYAELRFVDLDEGDDGLRFGGSYRLNDDWYLFGEISDLDLNRNFDQSSYEFGGGYIHELNQNLHLIATASLITAEIDGPSFDDSDTGIGLAGGVRALLAPNVEVRGAVKHINLDNQDTFLEIAGDYFFNEQFSAGVSIEFAGDRDLFTIGARIHF